MISTSIAATLSAFNCILCNKQFTNVKAYDEHTNSYAHAHRARAADLAKAGAALKSFGASNETRERERKREEKELRRAAKAAGIRMPKAAKTSNLASDSTSTSIVEAETIKSTHIPSLTPDISHQPTVSGPSQITTVVPPDTLSSLQPRESASLDATSKSPDREVEMAKLSESFDKPPRSPLSGPKEVSVSTLPNLDSNRSGWQNFHKKSLKR